MSTAMPTAGTSIKPPLRFRRTRIAVSLFFGMLTVAIVAFWVRSYATMDFARLKILPKFYIQVLAGDARMVVHFELQRTTDWFLWTTHTVDVHSNAQSDNRIPPFDLNFWPTFARLYLAHWVLAVTTTVLAVIPWCQRRYSLRTALVIMTALGLLIGTIAWVDQTF